MKKLILAAAVGCVIATNFSRFYSEAVAHTGSPACTTFVDGVTLTAAQLNNCLNHSHNTFSAAIVDAHIDATAAIQHSKLQRPALVPKAWAVLSANCDGAAAAGTDCTIGDSEQIPSANGIEATFAAGVYRVNLSYTPADTQFVAIAQAHNTTAVCMTDSRATAAPHFVVRCFDYAGAAHNNVQFSVQVLDN